MDLFEETKFIMKKYGIKANKNLGQNFLVDENIVNQIVEKSQIDNEDLVIEIGPGLGTLTQKLLEKAGKVISVELDTNMIKILQERFKLYPNFELIHSDILKLNLKEIIDKEKDNKKIKKAKIVANLPYYITTPIIMKLLEEKLDLETITVMVQKEVADRLTVIPGNKNIGAITYSVYYYSEAESIIDVNKDSFIPKPEVDSKVIQFKIRKLPAVETNNEKEMFKIIKNTFTQKRKTLINALVNTNIVENKQIGLNILNKLNIKDNIRAEELTLEDFAKITELIIENKNVYDMNKINIP